MNKYSKRNIWSIADCISFIICDDSTDDQVSASEAISSPSSETDSESVTLSSASDSGNETESTQSSSTDSSDWNTLSVRSLHRAKSIPIKKRKNTKHAIKPYSLSFIAEVEDLKYNLYDLFYPYTNLQSVLFSHLHPYIEIDYKKMELSVNQIEEKEKIKDDNMNWSDIESVKRIRKLIEKLLLSQGTNGIKEDNIYLMFSSPKPTQIIQQLRFGVLENLCKIHIDRFGRRTYHFIHNHLNVAQSMFDNIDMVGLLDFVSMENTDRKQGIQRQNYAIGEYLQHNCSIM